MRYEASGIILLNRNGDSTRSSPRTGMPPAGGSNRIEGSRHGTNQSDGTSILPSRSCGSDRLPELTLRQLRIDQHPSKIPGGVTPEDLAKIKGFGDRFRGRIQREAHRLQNGNTTVGNSFKDNIRVRIPETGKHIDIRKRRRYKSSKKKDYGLRSNTQSVGR